MPSIKLCQREGLHIVWALVTWVSWIMKIGGSTLSNWLYAHVYEIIKALVYEMGYLVIGRVADGLPCPVLPSSHHIYPSAVPELTGDKRSIATHPNHYRPQHHCLLLLLTHHRFHAPFSQDSSLLRDGSWVEFMVNREWMDWSSLQQRSSFQLGSFFITLFSSGVL